MMNLVSTMLIMVSLCINGNKYWEYFSDSEKNMVLKSENIPGEVIKLYNGQFILSDDDATFELLDELTSRQSDAGVKALYFHLFNRIFLSSDGALAEGISEYVVKVFLSDIPYALEYFTINDELMEEYGVALGTEFYYAPKLASPLFTSSYTFSQLKEKIKTDLDGSDKYDKLLSRFYKIIENTRKRLAD